MARSFLSFVCALSIVAIVVVGRATPASAQIGDTGLTPYQDLYVINIGPPAPATIIETYGVYEAISASQIENFHEVQEAARLLVATLKANAPLSERSLRLLDPSRGMSDAHRLLEEAVQKYPELPSAQVIMYQLLVQNNERKAARLWLNQALNVSPNDPEPYIILGNVALQDGRTADAALDFGKAKELLAGDTNTARKEALERRLKSDMARLAEARFHWTEAEALLRDLLKSAPDDLPAHLRLSRVLFWQGKAHDAYDVLKDARNIDIKNFSGTQSYSGGLGSMAHIILPENAPKKKNRLVLPAVEAIIAQYYDEFEGSQSVNPEKWFRAAIMKLPNDPNTREMVADWALRAGKVAFAKEQAEAALRIETADSALKPEDRKYEHSKVGRLLRGRVALWEKDWPTAEKNFQVVLSENLNDIVVRDEFALALVEQDDPAKKRRATQYAEANYREHNKSTEVLATLGWVYFRQDELDQAFQALDEAVKLTDAADKATYLPHFSAPPSDTLSMPVLVALDRTPQGKMTPDLATYVAHVLYQRGREKQAKAILERILKYDRAFRMQPEARQLYEKVKDTQKDTQDSEGVPLQKAY